MHGPPPDVPRGLWAYRLGAEGTLLGGAFSEGGNVLMWAQENLKLPPLAQFNAELSKLPPDGHGLTVLPFIAGERATGWSTSATGVIQGIHVSTTPMEILQAALESVSYRFALVARLLLPARGDYKIVASGGAIQSLEWWLQTMADVLDVPVCTSSDAQDTSRGTAILSLHALGVWPKLDTYPAEIDRTYEPQPERASLYTDAIARQQELYDRLLG